MIGIYKITNTINGNSYIGQSVDINARWYEHKRRAFKKGDSEYNYPLYRAFRKYGLENFTFEVLEELNSKDTLTEREAYYYETFECTYNQVHPNFGKSKTKEEWSGWGKQMSQTSNESNTVNPRFSGKTHSEESKKKISSKVKGELNPRYGVTLSEETKRKIGKANTGNRWSEESKQKMSKTMTDKWKTTVHPSKGRKLTDAHKDAVRKAQTGKVVSNETRKKISEARKGHVMSEETKKILSDMNKGNIPSNRRLTDEEVIDIRTMKKNGIPRKEVREKYSHIKRGVFTNVWTGYSYKSIIV